MNKKIKGSELIKKIENNDLEMIGRKIKFTSTLVLETKVVEVVKEDTGLYLRDIKTKEILSIGWLINSEIEILEDNTEEIEEYKGETFEQLGYEVRKMSMAIAKGFEKAIKEIRKDKNND